MGPWRVTKHVLGIPVWGICLQNRSLVASIEKITEISQDQLGVLCTALALAIRPASDSRSEAEDLQLAS